MIKNFLLLVIVTFSFTPFAVADKADVSQTVVPYTLADRERSLRLEAMMEQMIKRMDDMNLTLNKRMDDMNLSLNKRIDDLRTDTKEQFDTLKIAFGCVVTIFIALIIFLINMVVKDRKVIFPIEQKLVEIDLDLKEIKKETSFGKVITVFKELSKSNPTIAEVLKNNNIL